MLIIIIVSHVGVVVSGIAIIIVAVTGDSVLEISSSYWPLLFLELSIQVIVVIFGVFVTGVIFHIFDFMASVLLALGGFPYCR
ncbi:27387_t:CDS:2, partial [Dentiscutata erythropus]